MKISGTVTPRWLNSALLIGVFIISVPALGQFYNLGQDPCSLKWRQIKTEHFRLVYPDDFESQSQRMMNILEKVYQFGTPTLAHKPKQVPLIVHNRQITPNAFTIWSPRRIELYTTPPQNPYAQEWLEQLAIHEYRHAVQIDRARQGFTRGLSWLFGEIAPAGISGLFVPMWFMEGDAVCTETALSHSGRGRTPAFAMELRAQLLEKGAWPYNKAVMGSYRDWVPDQYTLGYHIVAHTRSHEGYRAWITALDRVARYPFLLTPFNQGLRKTTGLGKRGLYRRVITELDSLWRVQDRADPFTPFQVLSPAKPGAYVRYRCPHYISDSLIITERVSMDDISRFVILDRLGNERVLCTPGFFSSEVFSISTGAGMNKPGSQTLDDISFGRGILAWTEKESDPRWQNRSYSVIKTCDLQTGKIRQLTQRSRLFSPAISPDGNSLAAVDVTEGNIFSLVRLDTHTGDFRGTLLTASENQALLTPSWSEDGSRIVYILMDEHGKSICQLNTVNGEVRRLSSPAFTEISDPVYAGKQVLFTGAFSGIDNIFAIDTADLACYRITSSRFGAGNAVAFPGGKRFLYSDYSADGMRIAESSLDEITRIRLEEVADHSFRLCDNLVREENFNVIDSATIGHAVFASERYRKWSHLFKFHSWTPLYFNPLSSEARPGIAFMSQNDLSTATTVIGYDWDYGENTGRARVAFNWEGWYPVISTEFSSGMRVLYTSQGDTLNKRDTWQETNLVAGIDIPFVYNSGKYYWGIHGQVRTGIMDIRKNTSTDADRIEGTIHTMDYRFYAFRYIKQAIKDIYPSWGQVVDFSFRHTPFGDVNRGSIVAAEGYFFFPGLFDHHGIRMYLGYQHNSRGDHPFSDQVAMPRGYQPRENIRLASLAFTYKFPVLYPDVSMGSLIYMKRIKGALFYDRAWIENKAHTSSLSSYGADVSSDLHLLRFLFPFELGVRIGYKPAEKQWFTNLLFSVNLSI